MGKRFRPAYNAHGGRCSQQVEFKGHSSQYYSALRVSKRWSPFHLSKILGNIEPSTIVKSTILLWLHPLVLARCTRRMEWITIPFPVKINTYFKFSLFLDIADVIRMVHSIVSWFSNTIGKQSNIVVDKCWCEWKVFSLHLSSVLQVDSINNRRGWMQVNAIQMREQFV